MQDFARWLVTSDHVRDIYALFMVGVMAVPMIVLSIWYHRGIKRTPGGRRLMSDQNSDAHRPFARTSNVSGQLRSARTLHSGIMSGRYGSDAKRRQIIVYKVCGLWLAALAFFGAMPFVIAWLAGAL